MTVADSYTHYMLDLETLSTQVDAVVLAIAITPFTENAVFDKPANHHTVLYPRIQPQIDAGRHIDWETVAWWGQNSEAAREAAGFARTDEDRCSVVVALDRLYSDLRDTGGIWSKGPAFDAAVLSSLSSDFETDGRFGRLRMRRKYRCVRTLLDGKNPPYRPTDAHDPLDDAYAQAKNVVWALNSEKEGT